MKALIQRVTHARVEVDGVLKSEIKTGLLVLLGIAQTDTENLITAMVTKILNLRIFEDEERKMNMSLLEVKGELMVVSQFTLYADCTKGRRPSFTNAAKPEMAQELYKKFVQKSKKLGVVVQEGEFGSHMHVSLTNDGPVTIMLE